MIFSRFKKKITQNPRKYHVREIFLSYNMLFWVLQTHSDAFMIVLKYLNVRPHAFPELGLCYYWHVICIIAKLCFEENICTTKIGIVQARTQGGTHGGMSPPLFWSLLYGCGRRKEGGAKRGKEEKKEKRREKKKKEETKEKSGKERGENAQMAPPPAKKKKPRFCTPTCKEEKKI